MRNTIPNANPNVNQPSKKVKEIGSFIIYGDNMTKKKRVDNNDSASCPSCGKLFHRGKVHTANEKLKDHMWETGHCYDSNCPICGKQFHSGGYHPADQKLYDHMREKDECHRQRAGRMNWKISSWSHDVPRKLWFQY